MSTSTTENATQSASGQSAPANSFSPEEARKRQENDEQGRADGWKTQKSLFQDQADRIIEESPEMTFCGGPGHGWLKVKASVVKRLGLARESEGPTDEAISTCSYVSRDGHVYLEEDADLDRYVRALEARGGEFRYEHQHVSGQKIRAMRSASPELIDFAGSRGRL